MGDSSHYIQNSETGRFEGSEGSGGGGGSPRMEAMLANKAPKGMWADTRSSLTSEQAEAVSDYAGAGGNYGLVNGLLRENITSESREEMEARGAGILETMGAQTEAQQSGTAEQIANIDAAIANQNPTATEGTLYRGVQLGGLQEGAPDYSTMQPGTTFTDQGFVSTSYREAVAAGGHTASGEEGERTQLLQIQVPAGSQALTIGGKEGEVLLPRGTAFQVVAQEEGRTVVNAVTQDSGSPNIAALMHEPGGIGFTMSPNAAQAALTNTGDFSGLHAALGGRGG